MVSPCKERHNKNYIIDTTSGVINVKLITCSSDYVILSWWLLHGSYVKHFKSKLMQVYF
jgi:hypothetical protein